MADLDPDFQALVDSMGGKSPAKAASAGPTPDPSAGGGSFGGPMIQSLMGGPISTPQWLDRTLSGAGQGLTDIVRHAGNLVGLESDQDLQDAKSNDAPLLNTTAGRTGQFIGQTAALAPVGMGTGAALGRMGALGARLAANPITSGIAQGAVQGGVLADPGQRMQGVALGGAAGGVLPALGSAVGKIARGVTRTPEAQALLDKGVDLSLGQMNPGGAVNQMEQAAEGLPVVGGMVQGVRQNAMKQYSRAMVQDAMPPGQKLTTASDDPNDWIDEAAQKFDTAYDGAKGFPVGAKIMQVKGPDVPLSKALAQIATKPRIGLTADARSSWGQQLNDQLQEVVNSAKRSGGMQSDDLIAFRSAIRDAIRGEPGTDNASRASKGLLQDAQDKVTQALESQIPTDAASDLRATDQQYSRFATMRNAVKAAKDAPGGPTPFQIQNAIAQATPPNAYARGAGAGRDLSKAARSTFQNTVPRTGLAGMGMVGLPAAALGWLGASHPLVAGAAAAPGLMGAALDLTQSGRRLAAGNTGFQRQLQQGLMSLGNSVPQKMRNLPGLYARGGLLNSISPRLQQMPSQ